MTPEGPPADLLVVGAGLIGTSLGLALRGRVEVLLADASPTALSVAVQRGAGQPWDGRRAARLALVCTPPSTIAATLHDLVRRQVARTYSHVCSVQAPVVAELVEAGCDLAVVCGGHPMAGRERAGPAAALGELFVGRPWVLCPTPETAPAARAEVAELVVAAGATPVELSPQEHDASVALVSHLPQITSSALAAQLLRGGGTTASLAGPGLQDTTRLAASDASLWREVLRLNASRIAPLVRGLADDLHDVARGLEEGDAGPVAALLALGARGRELVPVKRGERQRSFTSVAVEVPDAPGQLAALFVTAGEAGVNVEDVRVDHVPGSPRGVIELSVRESARQELARALDAAGFEVLHRA